jgi:hypothetical protein
LGGEGSIEDGCTFAGRPVDFACVEICSLILDVYVVD